MGDITGPISSLPGTLHELPNGTMCEQHPNVPAVIRIQGETDSFGSELLDMCQACLDEHRAYMRSADARTGRCAWCKKDATDLRDTRDYEEGLNGPVYRVCGGCRKRREEEDRLAMGECDSWDDDGWYDDVPAAGGRGA